MGLQLKQLLAITEVPASLPCSAHTASSSHASPSPLLMATQACNKLSFILLMTLARQGILWPKVNRDIWLWQGETSCAWPPPLLLHLGLPQRCLQTQAGRQSAEFLCTSVSPQTTLSPGV